MQMARKNPMYRDTERECNKKGMKMARKYATYRDLEKKRKWLGKMQHRELVKIFKSWQVCDWLAKWIIMLRFMDLRWPRVFRRSNVGHVFYIVTLDIRSAYIICTVGAIFVFFWFMHAPWTVIISSMCLGSLGSSSFGPSIPNELCIPSSSSSLSSSSSSIASSVIWG